MAAPRRDPLFVAAVLKLSFVSRGEAAIAGWQSVYEGVLRDLALTDADVDAYLHAHRAEVEAAVASGG